MKFLHRCWILLLGTLLPSACGDNPIDTVEYGAPIANLKVDGVVVDNVGAPVKDIVVELEGFGSTTSDAEGDWSLETSGFSSCLADTQVVCGLVASDVDGPDNGGPYPPTLVPLDLVKTKPGSGWNVGTYEQHDIRIVMEDILVEYGVPCAKAALKRKMDEEGQPPWRQKG